jgi:putative tricarboxylic transport membrane protein
LMFDGFPMTRQGKAGVAIGALAGSAFVGSIIGTAALISIAPMLVKVAVKLGPSEYCLLAFFGIAMVAMIGGGRKKALKGVIMGMFGLFISFIGKDSTTGAIRYTFGIEFLEDGIPFIPACLGLFAMAQILVLAEEGGSLAGENPLVKNPWEGLKAVIKYWYSSIRGALVGMFFGAAPGIGITTASFMGYFVEKKFSKDPDSYGKGNVRGVIAPQAAANATTGGELIPALTMGIPGGPSSAMFIAALTLHGLQPGLTFFSAGGTTAYALFAGLLLTAIVFFVLGLMGTPLFARISKVPVGLLIPAIVLFTFVGSYAARNRFQDIIVTLIFAIIGYYLNRYGWPLSSMVLGLVLGTLLEGNLTRALIISKGSYGIFITRPISLGIFIIIILMFVWTYFIQPMRKRKMDMKA